MGGFIKDGSSDDYLLSGGGGHKHVAQLVRAPGTQSSVAGLQSTYTFWYVERSSNETLGFASGNALIVGQVLTVLVKNTGSTTITITVPSGWDSLDGSSLSVAAGKLLEISIMCYASSKYLVSSKGQ